MKLAYSVARVYYLTIEIDFGSISQVLVFSIGVEGTLRGRGSGSCPSSLAASVYYSGI
jgi:hypothetical protein